MSDINRRPSTKLSAKQREAARAMVYREPDTTKESIAAALSITDRTLRRWEATEDFQAEMERVRNNETRLTLDEAWRRLGHADRQRLVKRARREAGDIGLLDIRDELERILEKAETFWNDRKKWSTGDATSITDEMQKASAELQTVARRIRCLVTGDDWRREPTLEEIKERIAQTELIMKRAAEGRT